MARTKNRLSPASVKKLKTPGLYVDGGNLYLRVAPGGSRSWIFRFTLNGRTRDAGLGSYPDLGLAEARDHADVFRKQVMGGIDPITARTAQRAAPQREAAQTASFDQCAMAYIASHEAGWKNEKHRSQWRATLAMYASPIIGALPVKAVDTGLVMRVLEPIWTTKPETASRLGGRAQGDADTHPRQILRRRAVQTRRLIGRHDFHAGPTENPSALSSRAADASRFAT